MTPRHETEFTLLAAAVGAKYEQTTVDALHDDHGLDFSDDDEPGSEFGLSEIGDVTFVRVRRPESCGKVHTTYYAQKYSRDSSYWWHFAVIARVDGRDYETSWTIELTRGET